MTDSRPVPASWFLDERNIEGTFEAIVQELESSFLPDLIVQIADLKSPGGLVVGNEIQRRLGANPGLVTARVTNRHGEVDLIREVIDVEGNPTKLLNERILVVDDVVFSGSTTATVIETIRQIYEGASIAVTALVTHSDFNAREAFEDDHVRVICPNSTRGRKVNFPWGEVGWQGVVVHSFGESDMVCEVVRRPWGFYEDFAQNRECTVRVHSIDPGHKLSLQRHKHRDEFFVILDDGVACTIDQQTTVATQGDYFYVPRGTWHRLGNPTRSVARALEVAFGEYDQVGDIERREDDYGRTNEDGSI